MLLNKAIKEYETIKAKEERKVAEILNVLQVHNPYIMKAKEHIKRSIIGLEYDEGQGALIIYRDDLGYRGVCTRHTFKSKMTVSRE